MSVGIGTFKLEPLEMAWVLKALEDARYYYVESGDAEEDGEPVSEKMQDVLLEVCKKLGVPDND